MEGCGLVQISKTLETEKILNPTAYHQSEGRNTPHPTPENPYRWSDKTIVSILERREYIGCTVNFKTYTNSIWDKTQRINPVEKQLVFYNTHPAIVSQEVFDKVQNCARSGSGVPGREGQAFSPAFCIVTSANSECTFAVATIPKNIRTISYALPIVKTVKNAVVILSG